MSVIYKGVNTKVHLKSGSNDRYKGICWTLIQRNVTVHTF